jgi:hypothetical protein
LLNKNVPGPGPILGPGRGSSHCIRRELLNLFDRDIDAINDFMESCDEQEKSIIESTDDPKVLIKIVTRVKDDLEETSKDLVMEE